MNLRRRILRVSLPLLLTAFFLFHTVQSALAQATLTNEHVDLAVNYNGGVWSARALDRDNDVFYEPNMVTLLVTPDALRTRDSGSEFDFIGVAAGQQYWELPQVQDPDILFAGFSNEQTPIRTFDRYVTGDARTSQTAARWLNIDLVNVTGGGNTAAPGIFSLYQSGNPEPTVWYSTNDGISAQDSLYLLERSHAHFNFGFTQAGRYDVTLRASAFINTDNNDLTLGALSTSQNFTYTFNVQSANVPEGSTALLCASTGLCFWLIRLRHRQSRS